MNKYYDEFINIFNTNDKDECLFYCIEGIENGKFTIPELYEGILKPALYNIDKCPTSDPGCIWKEHLKTGIVRTIIEGIYPYVVKLGKKQERTNKKIILANPEKEYHELGLRMASDFFQICGYHTIYIGTNTPRTQICEAIKSEKPDYIAISITDYYLIFEAKKTIERIKENNKYDIKVILGGQAFKKNRHLVEEIGADMYLEDYRDIVELRKGESL
ncbi:MAG: cobalamin B12-binding domain-containing protein [Tissierellia bacterium]|nr:cobalamin B12-binding domain-containing protein [Tissierellia bacterium]